MTPDWLIIATSFAAVGSGLVAGVFFAFSSFVLRALARLPAAQGIAAMQSINVAVLRSWFMAVFFATAALSLLLCVLAALRWAEPGMPALLIAGALYLAGVIGVTLRGNVPLNTELAGAAPDGAAEAAGAAGAAVWARYLVRWGRWNHLRTLAGALACAAFVVALLRL